MNRGFIHLNSHSCHSLMAGADTFETLFKRAGELGMESLAITETNGVYGMIAAQKIAGETGVRHIAGALVDSPQAPAYSPDPQYALLLPLTLEGYGEMCGLITARHLDERFKLAKAVSTLSPDVIVISPDHSVIEAGKLAGRDGAMYVGLVNHDDTASRRKIAGGLKLARRFGVPCVATNNVHFAMPEGYEIHRVLAAIRENTTVTRLPAGAAVHKESWLKPAEAMRKLFAEVPEAVENAMAIADMARFRLETGKTRFPKFPVPGRETAPGMLRRLAHEGVPRRYGEAAEEVTRRMEYELSIIEVMGYADYFLAVWDIAREARQRGIPTCGRGSAANSIVCYLLGITDVCPITLNLYFERFLNPERTDHPDIDLDFPWNRRDEIINYVYEKYGAANAAMISTYNTFRGRSIIREVGKALAVPIEKLDWFTKKMPGYYRLSDIEEVKRQIPECRNLPLNEEPYRTIIATGKKIEGYPRGLSIHCGGIVIAPCPITRLVPLQRSAKGFNITQFDMYPVEDMGLVKIDLLGQKGLAVIADTMEDAEKHYGHHIDWRVIDPVADGPTRRIMREGRVIGCFYIESPGMRSLLRKLKVGDFETLVAASSIIRPGVSDSGMMKAYINRALGLEKPSYPHPVMERALGGAYGVMIYQEDVLKVANAVAGMGLGEADSLRKCMSKKRNWERMEKYRERFIEGAVERGVEMGVAEEIWRQVESFGGYAFCKAHSASFAVLSWRAAYLKAHYPAEFMAAVIRNRGGFYDTAEYIEEARRLGIRILPPDVNESGAECKSVRVREDGPCEAA
ncbi:MAG: DNA polymerase III subunit alpha [Nitrospinae bacterium]|nr:DNA polymerase III subunit alpha [Nitrospinota bacterium]